MTPLGAEVWIFLANEEQGEDGPAPVFDELGEIFSRAKLMSLPGVPSRRIENVFSRTGP